VSQHPEGAAVAKTISWGRDEGSARSIVILADYLAAGFIAKTPIATYGLIHELAHVHDDFSRGLVLAFPESQTPPSTTEWHLICAYLAQITWSEYAAESVAGIYITREDLRGLLLNDPVHLAGGYARLRQAIWSYKCGQRTLESLWEGSITELGDIFANLGRAIARVAFSDNYEEELGRLASSNSETACWKPVVETLAKELQTLGRKRYSEWGATPFDGIQETVARGFQVVGLFPNYDGSNLIVRVR
jgi:hypothetical protein